MNFEDERYVRVYTRKTVTMKLLGWDGRMCLHALLLEVDRAGVLDLDGLDPAEALAALADLPLEHARTGMAKLLDRKVVVVTNGVLFVPNFIRAQEAKQSDAQRQRESRARRAAAVRAAEVTGVVPPELAALAVDVTWTEAPSQAVTNRDEQSRPVTERHTESHAVTVGHSSSAVPSSTKPAVPEIPRVRAEQAPPPPKVADHQEPVKSPRNPAEAAEMPITDRASYVEQNRHLAEWLTPEAWPEVRAVAQAVHEANGMTGTARLLPYAKDSGVKAVVALFAAGFSLDELLAAVGSVTKTRWWRSDNGKPRSLGALSAEVIRREQAGARETQLSPEQRERVARALAGLKPDPNRPGPKGAPALLATVLPALAAGGES